MGIPCDSLIFRRSESSCTSLHSSGLLLRRGAPLGSSTSITRSQRTRHTLRTFTRSSVSLASTETFKDSCLLEIQSRGPIYSRSRTEWPPFREELQHRGQERFWIDSVQTIASRSFVKPEPAPKAEAQQQPEIKSPPQKSTQKPSSNNGLFSMLDWQDGGAQPPASAPKKLLRQPSFDAPQMNDSAHFEPSGGGWADFSGFSPAAPVQSVQVPKPQESLSLDFDLSISGSKDKGMGLAALTHSFRRVSGSVDGTWKAGG